MIVSNLADIVLVAIVLISVGISVWRGFVREILMLASAFLSIYAAYKYGSMVGEYCTFLSSMIMQQLCGYLLVFFTVSLTSTLIRSLIIKFVKFGNLGVIDHIGGGLFGLLRGGVSAAMLVTALHTTPIVHQDWWTKSTVIPYVEETTQKTLALLPEEWKKQASILIAKLNPGYA